MRRYGRIKVLKVALLDKELKGSSSSRSASQILYIFLYKNLTLFLSWNRTVGRGRGTGVLRVGKQRAFASVRNHGFLKSYGVASEITKCPS